VLVALIMVFASVSYGGTFVAFRSEPFVRHTGRPVTETVSFAVLNPNTAYMLRLFNGGPDGQLVRVSSAVLRLNGVQVMRPRDFNQNVAMIERSVTLLTDNTLEVELRGKPDGTITLEIIGIDNDLPTLTATIDPPPNAAGWHRTPATVYFDCTDRTSAIVTCSEPVTVTTEGANQVVTGRAVDQAGNEATLDVTLNIDTTPPSLSGNLDPLPNSSGWHHADVTVRFEATDALSGLADVTPPYVVTTAGAHQQINGTATDHAGNSSTTTVTVSLDKTAPSLRLTSPPDGTLRNDPQLTVAGTVSDALSGLAAATCNDVAASVTGSTLSCAPPLHEGSNEITARATDLAGNLTTDSIRVTLDTIPPVATITSPTTGSFGNSNLITVVGTVDDDTATVTVNGTTATVSQGIFTAAAVPLAEGPNTLTVTATDAAGNTSTVSAEVFLDTVPPTLTATVEPPPNPAGWHNADATVRFQATDNLSGIATVTDPVILTTEGSGQVVSGTAIDRAGNSSTMTVTVSLDKTAPSLHLTSPPDGTLRNDPQLTVAGAVSDALSGLAAVTCNDIATSVPGSALSCTLLLSEGINPIEVRATDVAGNTATASRTVTLDTTAPVVTITAPQVGALLNGSPITVTGTLDDPTATVEVNGIEASASGGTFTAAGVLLVEGPNVLSATATDAAGNVSTASRTVTLDTTPPQFTVTTPLDNAVIFEPQVQVAGSIDDNNAQVNVNGQAATVHDGQWDVVAVPLTLGANTITIVAIDAAGNSSQHTLNLTRQEPVLQAITVSPPALRLTEIGEERPLTVTGHLSSGATQNLTAASTGTVYDTGNRFVARVNADGVVTAVGNGAASITVSHEAFSATATVTVEAGITLEALDVSPTTITLRTAGATQQLSLHGTYSDGSSRDVTSASTGTAYESGDTAVAMVSADGLVTAVADGTSVITAHHEHLSAEALATVVISSGSGFLRGEVYDDTKGLPLAEVTITLLADGSGPLATPLTATADAYGQFVLPGRSGDALVRIDRDGFTSVERRGTIPQNAAFTLLDARLTPLDPRSNPMTSAFGGQARNAANTLALDLVAGSLAVDTDIRLTEISNQGLQGRLPPGWSPIAAVDVQPSGLTFGQPAELRLPNTRNLPGGSEVTAVFYDPQVHSWIGIEPAQVTADGTHLALPLHTSGQVALLLPDTAPSVPPAARIGQPLQGVAPIPMPAERTATGEVVPRSAPPGEEARATGTIVLETAEPLPSGTPVQARVSERYALFDTSSVVPLPFTQDLLLYARPRSGDEATLGTRFPITPSQSFSLLELELGVVHVDITAPGVAVGGTVVGDAGGTVTDPDGHTVEIPTNVLPTETVVGVQPLTADQLPVVLPDGFGLLGAVQLDLGGATLADTASLSLPRPGSLPDGAQVIIAAAIIDPSGIRRLRTVAVGAVQATRVVSQTTVAGLALPGIRTGGQYVFVQSSTPLGFVTGTISAPTGSIPQAGAVVSADTAPFADVTGSDGRYLIAAAVGTVNVSAALRATGDVGKASTAVQAQDDVATLDIALQVVAPSVVAVSPPDNASNVPLDTSVQVTFSEAVHPASVTANHFQVSTGGMPISGQIHVAPDGTSAILTPDQPLRSNTQYTVTLTTDIVDLAGHALASFPATSFTTVDTSFTRDVAGRISATAPDANGFVTVHGTVGTAEAGEAVGVMNTTTGVIVTGVAAADGSFDIRLSATTTDLLTVNLRTAAGTDTEVQIGAYTHADGSVTLGELGGTVSVDGPHGPITLEIPTGALSGQATVSITPFTKDEAVAELTALGLALPEGQQDSPFFGGALRIDAPGAFATTKLTLSIPVPPGLEAAAQAAGRTLNEVQTTVVRVEEFVDENGNPQMGFRELDSAKVIDGRLTTASPPFAGIGGVFSGFLIFFPFPQIFTSYVNGSVFITGHHESDPGDPDLRLPTAGEPCPHPDPETAKKQRCRAPGAVVRGVGPLSTAPLFYAVADETGHYAVTVPVGTGGSIGVSAMRPDAFAAVGGATSGFGLGIAVAPVRNLIMRRKPPQPDTTPPEVRILLSAVAVPVGTPVTLTVAVTDNDNRPASLTALFGSLSLESQGPGSLPPTPQQDPNDKRFKTSFTPDVAGAYTFRARAVDASGNAGSSAAMTLEVGDFPTPPGVNPPAGDPDDKTPPVVVGINPPPGASGVAPSTPVTVRFSEPVSRTILPVNVQVSSGGGALNGVVTLAAGQTTATFQPAGGLQPGRLYTVRVSGVKDLSDNLFDQDPIASGLQPFVSTFTTLDAPTPVDIAGDLSFNIKASRHATVFGNTLFFADGDSSATNGRILLYDVAAPQNPQRLAEINTSGQPRAMTIVPEFSYQGLDGSPSFYPHRKGFVGEAPLDRPRAMLFAVVFKRFSPASGIPSGTFLQFYDVTDPTSPVPVGANQRITSGSIGTKIKVANGRAFIKLADSPNPGIAVVDLRLALLKATLLPFGGSVLSPDGSTMLGQVGFPLIDADGSGGLTPDFDGLDANNDGDYNDPGDEIPDIDRDFDIVLGRFLTPGNTTDFDVNANGTLLFIADGLPLDFNDSTDTEPHTGLTGPYYGVGGVGPTGILQADAAGGLLIGNMSHLQAVPLVDVAPADGLDDRVLVRINTPRDDTSTSSTRVRLAEGLRFTQRVLRLVDGQEITEAVEVVKDVVFISNAFEATVTMLDVDMPNIPQRMAVVRMPPFDGGPPQPVELFVSGTSLFVDAAGVGTVEVDINRLVVRDETGPTPVFRSLNPIDDDGDGIDDRVVRQLVGVFANSMIARTGHAYSGTRTTAQIARMNLPRLEFVRFDGTKQELAAFDPTTPPDWSNAFVLQEHQEALEHLKPVDFLIPGRLHDDPHDAAASDDGDRDEPEYVYFVRASLPAAAADSDGTVTLTLESLDRAGFPLPDFGYAFAPTSYNSPRPGATPAGTRILKLHRQIADTAINGAAGQRLSSLGTLYISDPIFLTREPLRQADVNSNTGPVVLWAGATVRASLAGAGDGSNVASIYAPRRSGADLQTFLGSAHTTAGSFAAAFVDSPDPNPERNPSLGLGEAAGPVYLHNGEFIWGETDLSIRGRGMHYAFGRRYESQSLYNGPFGRGWEFSYNMRLQEVPPALPEGYQLVLVDRAGESNDEVAVPGDVICYDGTGRADLYRFTVNGQKLTGPDPNDPDELAVDLGLHLDANVERHYRSPRGFFTRLFKLKDGTFVVLERDGTRYRFGVRGKLTSITDRNGNRIDLLYDHRLRLRHIVDTMGRAIHFGYYKRQDADEEQAYFLGTLSNATPSFTVTPFDVDDPAGKHDGKIARQVDFIGRVVEYTYDDQNRLVAVTSPAVQACHGGDDCFPAGKTRRYDYHSTNTNNPRFSFQLATITSPREFASSGTPRIRNTYTAADGKLQQQTWGIPGDQDLTFAYSGALTTVTDRRGSSTEYTHNTFGHAEVVVEQGAGIPNGSVTTRFTFGHADGLLTELTLPEGNTVAYAFDASNARRRAQGNVLRVTRTPDARGTAGSAAQLVTRYDERPYDFRYNLVRSFTDPAQNPTTYEYDGNGNLLEVSRPEGIVETFTYNSFGQRLTAFDGERNRTDYVYHAESRPDGLTATQTTPLRAFDSTTGGYLKEVIVNAANGDNTPIDGSGPSRGAAQLRTQYLYAPTTGSAAHIGYVGNVTAIIDPRGVRTDLAVNERDQVYERRIAVTGADDGASALNYQHRFFYDGNDQVFRTEMQHDDTAFTVTDFFYNLLDDLEQTRVSTGEQLLITSYTYDPNQNVEQVTRPEGNKVFRTYEARDLVQTVTRGFASAEASTTTYQYDGNRNVVEVIDGRGNSTVTAFDGYDRRRQSTDRMQNVTAYTYDDNSLLKTLLVTGARSGQGAGGLGGNDTLQSVEYFYDGVYRLQRLEEAILGDPSEGNGADGFNTTAYVYDRNSRVLQITDDNGHRLRYYYDGANRLIGQIDELDNEVEYQHDKANNVITTIEREKPAGIFTSTATYDAVNRTSTSTDPVGNTRRFFYDAQNSLLRTIDAEQNEILYAYDLINRLRFRHQKLKSGGEIVTEHQYDKNSRPTLLQDDNGNGTTYTYDALNRVTVTTYPDGTTTEVETYDGNDNVVRYRDQNGNRLVNQYDLNDRLIQRDVTLAGRTPLGEGLDALHEMYEYDGLNRLTLAQDEDSTVEYVYDSLHRATQEIEEWRRAGMTRTVRSRYDGVGNRRHLMYPSGLNVEYVYDELDRIEAIHATGLQAASSNPLAMYSYTGPSRVSGRTYANEVHLDVGYDLDRRTTKVAHLGPPPPPGRSRTTNFDFRYNWSAEDQRVGEQRMHEGGQTDVYAHDSVYRLTKVEYNGKTTTPLDTLSQGQAPTVANVSHLRDYTYDGAHNLRTVPLVEDYGDALPFPQDFGTPTPRNQYETLTEDGTARTQTYDPNGNTTTLRLERRSTNPNPSFGAAQVVYDYRNQPIRIQYTGSTDVVTYRYDPLGRRIEKLAEIGGVVLDHTRYIRDEDREIAEEGARRTTDPLEARYIYGNQLDEVLVMERRDHATGQFRLGYYHENSIGSIAGLSDANGFEVEHYRYDAYGTPILELADFSPPQVRQVRTVAGNLEIDFTESLSPMDFNGLIRIDGVPASSVVLKPAVSQIPTAIAGVTIPAFGATLEVIPAAPLPVSAPPNTITIQLEVLHESAGDRLLDISGNQMAADFSTTFIFSGADANVFDDTAAVHTGPTQLGISAAGNPFLFHTRRYDPETGLYYYRNRYYAPSIGRFLQNDPKGYEDGPNLYAAFGNNPANNTDPYGTKKKKTNLEKEEQRSITLEGGWKWCHMPQKTPSGRIVYTPHARCKSKSVYTVYGPVKDLTPRPLPRLEPVQFEVGPGTRRVEERDRSIDIQVPLLSECLVSRIWNLKNPKCTARKKVRKQSSSSKYGVHLGEPIVRFKSKYDKYDFEWWTKKLKEVYDFGSSCLSCEKPVSPKDIKDCLKCVSMVPRETYKSLRELNDAINDPNFCPMFACPWNQSWCKAHEESEGYTYPGCKPKSPPAKPIDKKELEQIRKILLGE
jgi:RHS repeat-associated protein